MVRFNGKLDVDQKSVYNGNNRNNINGTQRSVGVFRSIISFWTRKKPTSNFRLPGTLLACIAKERLAVLLSQFSYRVIEHTATPRKWLAIIPIAIKRKTINFNIIYINK